MAGKTSMFDLRPELRSWLNRQQDSEDAESDEIFDRWLERVEEDPGLLRLGKVMVDPEVLGARFACVPDRCAPGPGRGKARCCCADLTVGLTPAEKKRIRRHAGLLKQYLVEREPRIERWILRNRADGDFWFDSECEVLRRMGRRCVFSEIDGKGRIRCRLYAVARRLAVPVTDIQPYTCKIFPLVFVQLDRGRVLLTVLSRGNWRGLESVPPSRLPCLSDPALPPLLDSMARTLDWAFGKGFASYLRKQARKRGLYGTKACTTAGRRRCST